MRSRIGMVIRAFLLSVLAVSLSFSGGQVSGQASDATAIKECIIEYFRFARDKDKTGVATLLSRTPPEYWRGGEKQIGSESSVVGPGTSHSLAPLDDLSFQALTGLTFLVAGKAKIDRNQIQPVIVNGNLAKASVVLDFGENKPIEDFLLQKKQGKWTIFRIDRHDVRNSFPR